MLSCINPTDLRHWTASGDQEEVGGAHALRVRLGHVERDELQPDLKM
jgi:hypothetical protein